MIEELFSRGELEAFLLALVLSAARPLMFLSVVPIFNRLGLQAGLVRGGVVIALAAPVLPGVYGELLAGEIPSTLEIAWLLIKEVGIGLLLGLALGVPFWALSAAGNMIDFQRGASIATIIDPGSGADTTPTDTLFLLIAVYLLMSNDWFVQIFVGALYDTYKSWPVFATIPQLDANAAERALSIIGSVLKTGLLLSFPILAPLLLIEIVMAFAFKETKQINVLLLALSFKQVIYVFLLPIYFSALMYYSSREFGNLGGTNRFIEGFFGGGP